MYKRDLCDIDFCIMKKRVSTISRELVLDVCSINSCDTIYFIDEEKKLYGIICIDEIMNIASSIEVKKRFYSIKGFNDNEAAAFFLNHPNVNKLPVIDEYGHILGDYSRIESLSVGYFNIYIKSYEESLSLKQYMRDNDINSLTVKLYKNDDFKLVEAVVEYFKNIKIELEVVKCDSKIEDDEKQVVLVLGEEGKTALKFEYGKHVRVMSLKEFLNAAYEWNKRKKIARLHGYEQKGVDSFFYQIMRKGVKVCALYNDIYYVSHYVKDIARCNRENQMLYHISNGEFWPVDSLIGKEFFDDLLENEDYLSGVAQRELISSHTKHAKNVTINGKYYNVVDGRRRTCFQPENSLHRVFMFGNCFIMGAYHEDQYTIASWLQKKLVKNGLSYTVINCGLYENVFESITKEEYKEGDYIVFWAGQDTFPGCESIEIRHIYENNKIPSGWLLNEFTHVNHRVTECIAETLYTIISNSIQNKEYMSDSMNSEINGEKIIKIEVNNYNDILGNYIEKIYLRDITLKETDMGNACIVVDISINPTIYIKAIQEIANYESTLYVFVPKDIGAELYGYEFYFEKLFSAFCATENVVVLRGDGFVPYFSYFHTYYYYYQGVGYISESEAHTDARIFSQCIAEKLNINKRYFVSRANSRQEEYMKLTIDMFSKFNITCVDKIIRE